MVHALTQIRRVLAPGGIIADLRPDRRGHRRSRRAGLTPARLPRIYVGSDLRQGSVGVLQKAAKRLADHRAADATVQQVLRRGLFALRTADTFEFRYYFRTLAHLDDHLANRWVDTSLPLPTRGRLLTRLRRHPSSGILVVEPVQLNVLISTADDRGRASRAPA
jgi:hypothetical protein